MGSYRTSGPVGDRPSGRTGFPARSLGLFRPGLVRSGLVLPGLVLPGLVLPGLMLRRLARDGLVMAAAAIMVPAPAAHAVTPASFTASADQPLRFGTMVTVGSGSRTVGPDGSTSNASVFPLGDRASGPAQFTMTYARASGDHNAYQLIFQFSLPAAPNVNVAGVQGSLGGFTTDLPGVAMLNPGQTAVYTMPNCVAATCSVTFHVGGTLTIQRTSGGASLNFPLTLLTTVTTVFG